MVVVSGNKMVVPLQHIAVGVLDVAVAHNPQAKMDRVCNAGRWVVVKIAQRVTRTSAWDERQDEGGSKKTLVKGCDICLVHIVHSLKTVV